MLCTPTIKVINLETKENIEGHLALTIDVLVIKQHLLVQNQLIPQMLLALLKEVNI